MAYWRNLPRSIFDGSLACHLLKNTGKVVSCAETQGGGDLLHGLVSAFQQNLCTLNLCKFNVITNTKACFRFEFVGQVILGITNYRRQIGGADLLVQVHFNVIHTLLHRATELGIGARRMKSSYIIKLSGFRSSSVFADSAA